MPTCLFGLRGGRCGASHVATEAAQPRQWLQRQLTEGHRLHRMTVRAATDSTIDVRQTAPRAKWPHVGAAHVQAGIFTVGLQSIDLKKPRFGLEVALCKAKRKERHRRGHGARQ